MEEEHLEILRTLHTYAEDHATNCILPLLELLSFEDKLAFAVFPFMSNPVKAITIRPHPTDCCQFMVNALEVRRL